MDPCNDLLNHVRLWSWTVLDANAKAVHSLLGHYRTGDHIHLIDFH